MTTQVLVTGGFGFVGGRAANHLQSNGYSLVLGTSKQRAQPKWISGAHIVSTPWFDKRSLSEACRGIHTIVHAAGVNAQDCLANPVSALEINGLATARLVAEAIKQGVKRILYLSSAHVYASPLSGVLTERTCTTNLHPYATSHRAGEDAVLGANARNEIEGLVLRLSNAFGEPMHSEVNCWMLLVNDLCLQAVHRRQLVLKSGGTQLRDFVTMADVARAVTHLAELPRDKFGDSIFNVGTGSPRQVLSMAHLVASRCDKVLGYLPSIDVPSVPVTNSENSLTYCIDKLISTGFVPFEDFDAEIDRTLLYCAREHARKH